MAAGRATADAHRAPPRQSPLCVCPGPPQTARAGRRATAAAPHRPGAARAALICLGTDEAPKLGLPMSSPAATSDPTSAATGACFYTTIAANQVRDYMPAT